MVYHYYDAYVAFGFVDNKTESILSYKSLEEFNDISVFATEIIRGYISKAFIGFTCQIDPKTGIPQMDQNKYKSLMKFIEKYRTYHGIPDEEQLDVVFRPVLRGDYQVESSYDFESDSDSDSDSD